MAELLEVSIGCEKKKCNENKRNVISTPKAAKFISETLRQEKFDEVAVKSDVKNSEIGQNKTGEIITLDKFRKK